MKFLGVILAEDERLSSSASANCELREVKPCVKPCSVCQCVIYIVGAKIMLEV